MPHRPELKLWAKRTKPYGLKLLAPKGALFSQRGDFSPAWAGKASDIRLQSPSPGDSAGQAYPLVAGLAEDDPGTGLTSI